VTALTVRELGPDEVGHVQWALYQAVSWDPGRKLPPFEVTIEHPQLAMYHRDWGRFGDLALAAETDGDVVGVAFFRLFTEDEHGHGFVDDRTPELGIAVRDGRRGEGIGTLLLAELAARSRERGIERLSLSVESENPALRLYARLGYREISRDDTGGIRMVLDLGGSQTGAATTGASALQGKSIQSDVRRQTYSQRIVD
jgi:GNAT superfamily N-acetyltransferase